MEPADKARAYGDVPVQLWTANPAGDLDYVNQAVTDYFAVGADRLLRDGWRDVCHPLDLTVAWQQWQRCVASGEPYEVAFRLLRGRDRLYRWHISRAVAVRGEDGSITGWIGTNSEIDDLKRAEELGRATMERTRRDRDRWQQVFDLLPFGLIVTALPGEVVELCNPAARPLAATRDVVGLPLAQGFPALQALVEVDASSAGQAATGGVPVELGGRAVRVRRQALHGANGIVDGRMFVLDPVE